MEFLSCEGEITIDALEQASCSTGWAVLTLEELALMVLESMPFFPSLSIQDAQSLALVIGAFFATCWTFKTLQRAT